jgi:hypothetical protein
MTSLYRDVSVTYVAFPKGSNIHNGSHQRFFTSTFIVGTGDAYYSSVAEFKQCFLSTLDGEPGEQLEASVREWCDCKGRQFVKIVDVADPPDQDESEECANAYFCTD